MIFNNIIDGRWRLQNILGGGEDNTSNNVGLQLGIHDSRGAFQ